MPGFRNKLRQSNQLLEVSTIPQVPQQLPTDLTSGDDLVEQLEQVCAENGLHVTSQRRLVVRVLSQADDHPTIDEVYERAVALDPNISLATVYRTVRMLEEAGVVDRRDFGGTKARYEHASKDHHDHLINLDTGEVVEFRDVELEKAERRIAKRLGYRLVNHRLELFGVPLEERIRRKR